MELTLACSNGMKQTDPDRILWNGMKLFTFHDNVSPSI